MLQKFSLDSWNICFYKADLAEQSVAAVSWGVFRKLIDVFAKKGVSFPYWPFRGVKIGSVLATNSFSSFSFFHNFQKGDSYSKKWSFDPLPFIPDTCFPAATDVFFLRSSIRSTICLWLANIGPECAWNSKTEKVFFSSCFSIKRWISDVSRNIANSGPSKRGLDAKRQLKR